MEDEDMEDINRPMKETCTIVQGSLSHHVTHSHLDGRYSLHLTHSYSPHHTTPSRSSYAYLRHDTEPLTHHTSLSHVVCPYPTYTFGPSSSHYTSSSPPGHPYPHQHATLSPAGTVYTPQHGASPLASHHDITSPPVHVISAQHGTIPNSSRHSTSSPPGYVYPHEHGIRPSSSHHATQSPSAHPAHSPRIGDEYTSTSHRPPAPHRNSFARSSTNRLRSSIPPEMSTQYPDTSIDEDAVYLEVAPEVKGRVYGLGSQGYHRSISSGEASPSRGPTYGPYELEELQQDH
ncbi:hypothetical protein Syun_006735 [Stephania yunnanensis]|uniref:Uncharacterized protein n=1 Tax=Stephania yunnanensis TaxID=152371 RepID=A0AAP0L0K3_9MAGN